jgi:hypothetical protein
MQTIELSINLALQNCPVYQVYCIALQVLGLNYIVFARLPDLNMIAGQNQLPDIKVPV